MLSRNLNICGGYDSFFAHHLILGLNLNICERYNLFFCSSRDFGAPLTKGLKRNFCPGAQNFARRLCAPAMAEAFLKWGGPKAMTRFPSPTIHIYPVHIRHVQFMRASDPRFLLLVSASFNCDAKARTKNVGLKPT